MGKPTDEQVNNLRQEFKIKSLEYAALVHVYCRSFRASPERVIQVLSKYGIKKSIPDIEDINPEQYVKAVRALEADYEQRTNILKNMGLIGRTESHRNPSYRDLRERLQSEAH